jgi:hypothetical protein
MDALRYIKGLDMKMRLHVALREGGKEAFHRVLQQFVAEGECEINILPDGKARYSITPDIADIVINPLGQDAGAGRMEPR